MAMTFLLGGARSGKSLMAVDLAVRSAMPVTFIATAPPPGDDAEMLERIERHRADRPGHWTTLEEPVDLVGALSRADGTFTIVDCLSLWVSNLMWDGRTDIEIDDLAGTSAARAAAATDPMVVVSNEVGMAVHPDTALGRRYRDALGRVNQRWAAHADDVLLVVAGRVLRLEAR